MKLAVALLCLLAADTAGAQVRLRPRPLVTIPGTMTVTASISNVNFSLTPNAIAAGSQTIAITTTWLIGIDVSVKLYGYFSTTNALSTAAGDAISTANVLGQCATGSPASFTALTQSGPFGTGSSLQIFSRQAFVSVGATYTDILALEINLQGVPQQPAGTYSGTLNLQAQAY